MRKIIFISLALSLLFICGVSAGQVNVRVAIIRSAQDLRLTIKGPYQVLALNTNAELFSCEENLKYVLATPDPSGINLGKDNFKVYGLTLVPKATKEVFVNGCPFKGTITLIRTEDMKLLVVNNLDLEDYLKGVLFHEVSHLWPLEVLKAQAVAARTFALSQIEARRGFEFDVTSDIYSQVYGGSYSERKKASLAVDSTKGEILTFKEKLFPAYYHAVCAGHTEDASVLWKINIIPLRGVICNFCKISPHYNWEAKINAKDIQDKLVAGGFKVSDVVKIEPKDFTKSGRIKDIKIIFGDGSFITISGKDFRQALNPNVIRSANFSVEIKDSEALFKGKGWGHGVGLCQWGAFFMAAQGNDYQRILQYYYPGSKIEKIK